jgi:predicted RNA methylase
MHVQSASRPVLAPAIRDALATAQVDGTKVRLAEQLPTDDYHEIACVLAALGGLWSPTAAATLFPDGTDPATLITATLAAAVVPVHPRTAEGWVRTPDDLADDLCCYPHTDLPWLPACSQVLEPSAGIGSLVAAMLRANPQLTVTAVEPNPARAAVCASLGPSVSVHTDTFEAFAARAMTAGLRYAAIVMNPPFAIPSDRHIWIEHLRLAWHLLAPGARLVCVVPAGLADRGHRAYRDIRAFVEHHGTHEAMPSQAFKPSGTTFPTRIVRVTKPVRTDPPDFLLPPPRLAVPVRVAEPRLSGEAAATAPVQVWWDAWRRKDRVLRYRGRCVVCGWLLWGFDDGENDPRGILGDFTAGFSLDAEDYDLHGPSVGLCCGCANDGDHYEVGLDRARTHWSTPAATPLPAAA